MDPLVLDTLYNVISEYNALHAAKALPHNVPNKMKNLCISTLDARMEALAAEEKLDDDEYKECSFLSDALRNGWLVSDLEMLMGLYEAAGSMPVGSEQWLNGKKILAQVSAEPCHNVASRFDMLKIAADYLLDVSFKTKKAKEAYGIVNNVIRKYEIYQSEYPKDNEFGAFAQIDEGQAKTSYVHVLNDNDKRITYQMMRDTKAREKDDYVISQMTAFNLRKEQMGEYVPNDGQKHNGIKKSNREVIKEVFGADVYDEIDDMKIGSYEERKVPIIHSQGTKAAKQGHEVLEIEIAGSGAEDVLKYHKGRKGEIDIRFKTPDDLDKLIGKKVKKKKGKTFEYIRRLDKTIKSDAGYDVEKQRYAIAGCSPDWGFLSGLFNLGEYSIESTKINARNFAREFIEPHLEKWLNKTEEPHPIDIFLSGHSRGAVAAGQAVKKINEWMSQYIESHPGSEEFKKYINYNLTLIDPVPGMITDLHLSSCNLRDIPNVNTSVICSAAQDHFDMLFPLQHVKGSKKIILTTNDHLMDIWKVDDSQVNTLGDGKKHAMGYYDAETGEMYRGSGISQMPDGVYISDEKHNIVRLTSYSQVSKFFKSVYGDVSPQRRRCNNIHHMVRDWFIENQLEMSFSDAKERIEQTERASYVEDRILAARNKRINPVQAEIMTLRMMKDQEASKEDIILQQKKIIEVCRTYMKKTRIPASGDSEYRMDLVSDLLSFTMRETNQLEKELNMEKGIDKAYPLDEKIRVHKERLENKSGLANRKLTAEKNRLKDEEELLKIINDTAKLCDTQLKILDKTRVGKITSEEYDDFRSALVEGSKLGEGSTMKEVIELLKKVTKVSDNYVLTHDSLLGPLTGDGAERLNIAKSFADYSKKTGKTVETKSLYYGDKEISIGSRIRSRKESIDDLKIRVESEKIKKQEDKQKKVEAAKQSLQPARR